jgi:hypothetical protein
MAPIEVIERTSPLWDKAWSALSNTLKTLPPTHPLFGETSIDPFMLMYRRGDTCSFKHVASRAYLHVEIR